MAFLRSVSARPGSPEERSPALGLTRAILFVVVSACSTGQEIVGTFVDAGVPPVDARGPEFEVGDCTPGCSLDGRTVLDPCRPGLETRCAANEVCSAGACVDACGIAERSGAAIGCDYWAVAMDIIPELAGSCFVSMVTNTFTSPAHVTADFRGTPIDLAKHAAIPRGEGRSPTYEPYDPVKGLAPGDALILFLMEYGGVPCPIKAARSTGASVIGSGVGDAFHVASDVPLVAYQMLPYGGGSAAVTGATLLLPTSAWGRNYVAATAHPEGRPSLDLVAAEDGTEITILPRVAIRGREGLFEGTEAGVPRTWTLKRGAFLQITQEADLTGAAISSNKKIAVFGGSPCIEVPKGLGYCDHAEQQIPPVGALGSEYVAAPHRPRIERDLERRWRVVGAVDGTTLVYDPPGVGPTAIGLGDAIEFTTTGPFVVRAQDAAHPFMLFGYMGGGDAVEGYGDPEWVRMVTPGQYLDRYVFLTDPTYPETSVVLVRAKKDERFVDVELGCLGRVTGWSPVGDLGRYEIATVDLVRHDFVGQGKCDNGVQIASSLAPFGAWVWGWGGPETSGGSCGPWDRGQPVPGTFTCHVSYGFPAGESVRSINDVVVPSVPR
jgi:hypothetical protein